ncbi:MAG: hypothetical protein ACRCXZ_02680, partial [Patescibacteria group bacterium]
MKASKSHKKAIGIILIICSILVLLPLTIFGTFWIMNFINPKPKNPRQTQDQPINNIPKASTINDKLQFSYLNFNNEWTHNVIKSEENNFDKLKTIELEIKNNS